MVAVASQSTETSSILDILFSNYVNSNVKVRITTGEWNDLSS